MSQVEVGVGNGLVAATAAPVAPPVKALDEVFCQSCAKAIKKEAVICVHCGVPAKPGALAVASTMPKSKTTAVVLAVLLSFWTWCYTYKRDASKFWIGLGVGLVGIFLLGIPSIGVWIWAMVDAAKKPHSYYTNFPNEA